MHGNTCANLKYDSHVLEHEASKLFGSIFLLSAFPNLTPSHCSNFTDPPLKYISLAKAFEVYSIPNLKNVSNSQ